MTAEVTRLPEIAGTTYKFHEICAVQKGEQEVYSGSISGRSGQDYKDTRFQIPSRNSIIRMEFYVEPMGETGSMGRVYRNTKL